MKKATVWFSLAIVLASTGAPAQSNAPAIVLGTNQSQVVVGASNLHIVTLRPGVNVDAMVREFGLNSRHIYRHALKGFAVRLNLEILGRLKQDPRVLAVEEDGQIAPAAQTIPTGIVRMGITNFPLAHIDGQDHRINVDVAVLDTGIQTNHPDLNVVQAVDFTGEGHSGDDWNGHGTHVAGIIGALDNDIGVVGVAPGVRLWSVQVLGQTNHTWSAFLAGVDYIAANADKIAVVNASLTGQAITSGMYDTIHQAVSNLVSLGVVFVAAVGNNSTDIINQYPLNNSYDIIPAALPEVMAVSAMDTNDTIASFSNYSLIPKPSPSPVVSTGASIDVAAPGRNILSTWINSSYALDTGTSMSSAHAAGLVALCIAANGRASSAPGVEHIRQIIIDNSQPQYAWHPTNCVGCYPGYPTADPDSNREPLAYPSEAWAPPAILAAGFASGYFQFNFATARGYVYLAQYTDALGSSNQWDDLFVTNGPGGAVTVPDTNSADARFYRLVRTAVPQIVITNFVWTNSGAAPWLSQTNVTHGGGAAFQSGAVGPGQQSVLQTAVTGPGLLSYWWQGQGSVDCSVDGVLQPSGSGTAENWEHAELLIATGSHAVQWAYSYNPYGFPGRVGEIVLTIPNPWADQ